MGKKDQILNAAESLFNQQGYTSVGVDLIRDSAKVSKTSMYRHFSSKTELIKSVLERRHERFESSLTLALNGVESPRDRVDTLLDWHFDWFESEQFKGCMFMHALGEFKETEADISALSYQHKRWLKKLVSQALNTTSEIKTELILTLLEGMIVRSEFEDTSRYREAYRKAVQNLAGTEC
jgi:AcrR family transcriptional regulator